MSRPLTPSPVHAPLRVAVTLPRTRVGVGALSFDPLEHLLGARVADLLGPLLAGPVGARATPAGAVLDVYPLALPDGEGAALTLGGLGELGLRHEAGLLVVTVPAALAPLLGRLGDAVVRGPYAAGRLVEARLRLRPGLRASLPLGGLGELGVEAA